MANPSILFVFGTRPECIKLAPLILEAQKRLLTVYTCFTGQHREMAMPILDFFKIGIDFNLQIMKPGQSLNEISSALFEKLAPVLSANQIKFLIVQGDTTTAAVAAMMAFQSNIEVVHVEAGLRTNNLNSPFPEEFNRRVISLASKWHFAPTQKAEQNLVAEGFEKQNIFMVGNTGIDALRLVVSQIPVNNLKYKTSEDFLILVTLHRRESFGDEMVSMMEGIKDICNLHPSIKIVWPMHQNPNVREAFNKVFSIIPGNLIVESPMGYFEFISAMHEADLIITDSGGVQEEAPFLGKPILVCRLNTERPESVGCGSAKLVGTARKSLVAEVLNLFNDKDEYLKMAVRRTPYGDGYASKKIIDVLTNQMFLQDLVQDEVIQATKKETIKSPLIILPSETLTELVHGL